MFYNGKGDTIGRFHCHTYFGYYIYENFFVCLFRQFFLCVTSPAISCPGIHFGEQTSFQLPEIHVFLHPSAGIRNPCYHLQSSPQLILIQRLEQRLYLKITHWCCLEDWSCLVSWTHNVAEVNCNYWFWDTLLYFLSSSNTGTQWWITINPGKTLRIKITLKVFDLLISIEFLYLLRYVFIFKSHNVSGEN